MTDEATVVDTPRGPVRGGVLRPRVLCCGGTGYASDILDAPFVTPCWCPAGLRLRCAVPEDAWPMLRKDARAAGKRIGLRSRRA